MTAALGCSARRRVRTLNASVRAWGAACGIAALLMAAQGPVRADVIVSVGNNVDPILTESLGTGFNRPLASSFAIGPTSVLLESVVMPLGQVLVPTNGSAVFRDAKISIYSDSSNAPGVEVTGTSVTLNYDINSSMSDRTFTLSSPVALSANTTYWLVLDQAMDSIDNYLGTYRTVLTSSNAILVDTYATPNAGTLRNAAWTGDTSGDPNWNNASLVYQLNGTAVPEASSLIFLGACSLGAVGVAAWRRRSA